MTTQTQTTERKTRTITMTGRQPVRIYDDEWAIIAMARDDSYGDHDYARHQQALAQGEVDQYAIRVRQHHDGRTLVSAVLEAATAWTGSESIRGGYLLTPPADAVISDTEWYVWPEIAETIRRVGEECQIPESVIRDCIADLPPEPI